MHKADRVSALRLDIRFSIHSVNNTRAEGSMGGQRASQRFSSTVIYAPSCGEDFMGSGGSINSPNYPSYYPDDVDCYWTVTSETNTEILVSFEDFYTYNDYDYLVIRYSALIK
ncbi:unnamed protein product, partial [Meganyctiphanes norvegica]